jgi:hypothetical protein
LSRCRGTFPVPPHSGHGTNFGSSMMSSSGARPCGTVGEHCRHLVYDPMMSENTIFVVLLIGWTVALGVLGTLIVAVGGVL